MPDFSDFIVYVDEGGGHGLATVDPQSPMFVLACCVFQKVNYAEAKTKVKQRTKTKGQASNRKTKTKGLKNKRKKQKDRHLIY